jgi:hypothetical protein
MKLFLIGVLGWASLAFGTSSNCPTSATALGTINLDSSGMTSSTLTTNGCGAVDQTFSNMGQASAWNGTGGGEATALMTLNSSPTGQTVTLGGTWTVSAGAGAGGSGSDTYLTQFGTGTSPATDSSIQAILVTFSGIDLPKAGTGSNAELSVTIGVCEGPTSLGGATTGALPAFAGGGSCTGNGGTGSLHGTAYISATDTLSNLSTTNAITNGTLTFGIALPTTFSAFAIDTTITLTGDSVGATSFSGYTEDFESPEPSSFILLGTALVGVALLRCYQSGLFTRAFAGVTQAAQARMGVIAPPSETVEIAGDTRASETRFRFLRRRPSASSSGPPSSE